jgi:unsaturated rhamnogalacturonyl hydrolase
MNEVLIRAVASQIMSYPFKVWGFGEGIALEALWQAGSRLHETEFQCFVEACFEQWFARDIVEADHSAPGMLLLELYQVQRDQRYLQRALALHQHFAGLSCDSVTGARYHRPTHPDYASYLYVDCMEVDAPFLAMLGKVTEDSNYYDEAVNQIEGYAALLQDEETGLFYHQFDYRTREVNGAFWGRGNGWALHGLVKTLALLPASHIGFYPLQKRLERLVEALAAVQHADGTWSTVLDQPHTYRESSLPAFFASGILQASRAGFLPTRLAVVGERAAEATMQLLQADGRLPAISIATPPGNRAHYNSIATGHLFPWGQGPALLTLLA